MRSKRLPLLGISSFNRSSFVIYSAIYSPYFIRAVYRYGALRSWANKLRRSPQKSYRYYHRSRLRWFYFPPAVTSYRRGIRILLLEHHRILGGSILRNSIRRYCGRAKAVALALYSGICPLMNSAPTNTAAKNPKNITVLIRRPPFILR